MTTLTIIRVILNMIMIAAFTHLHVIVEALPTEAALAKLGRTDHCLGFYPRVEGGKLSHLVDYQYYYPSLLLSLLLFYSRVGGGKLRHLVTKDISFLCIVYDLNHERGKESFVN